MADAGLEIRDANDAVIFTVTDDVGRFLGSSIYVGANSSGSIDVPEFEGATGFFIAIPDGGDVEADVTISGRTLSWRYGSSSAGAGGTNANTTIYYGAFG